MFTQEAVRRLRNTSISLGPEVANKFLSEYMLKLKSSGYNKRFRTQIVKSAKNAFKIQLENDKLGVRPLFRDKQRIISDQKLRGKGQVDWWNKPHYKNPEVQKYNTVLFVPPTPGGALAKQMQLREIQINSGTDDRIKVVERGGQKLRSILVQKNPYPKMPCHRELCPFCGSTLVSNPAKSTNLPCNTPGVGYQITCLSCKEQDHIARYEGETGRPAVTRGIEHIREIMAEKTKNPMVKHQELKHPGKKVTFEFGLTRKFKDPLTRQAEEGLRISRHTKSSTILNSKSEFNHPPIGEIKVPK